MSADSLDNQDFLSALLLDLYNAENIGSLMKATLLSTTQANWTFTTTSYVASGAPISYTPTKANMIVKWYHVLSQSSGASTGTLQVRFNGNAGGTDKPAVINSSAQREMVAMGIFTGLTIGTAHNIELYGKVTTGTLTVQNSVANHILEVIEYD